MTTTIKVSNALRDRLKEQAAREGLTLGAHLDRLADAQDRQWRLQSLKTAVGLTAPGDADSHRAETREWERAEDTDAEPARSTG
ncbi:hypothetical protein [Microbacterium sp. 179-I 3D3 NHS]|uniref:hypothetical protein n=1 Tax=unclassified Microbacterium TaxID=2609290 RepID=UPI0039A1C0C6